MLAYAVANEIPAPIVAAFHRDADWAAGRVAALGPGSVLQIATACASALGSCAAAIASEVEAPTVGLGVVLERRAQRRSASGQGSN